MSWSTASISVVVTLSWWTEECRARRAFQPRRSDGELLLVVQVTIAGRAQIRAERLSEMSNRRAWKEPCHGELLCVLETLVEETQRRANKNKVHVDALPGDVALRKGRREAVNL